MKDDLERLIDRIVAARGPAEALDADICRRAAWSSGTPLRVTYGLREGIYLLNHMGTRFNRRLVWSRTFSGAFQIGIDHGQGHPFSRISGTFAKATDPLTMCHAILIALRWLEETGNASGVPMKEAR